ncbi:MAG: HTH domain-containing protein [Candidatus Zixiibacteriota bacterium]
MTKSERLLYLIRLMREGKGIRLKTLSETCQVSQRTVYRDLISLSRVNVPVRLEKSGYRIARENSSLAILAEFPDERDLVRLILRTTELARIDLFADRIVSLDARLARLHKETDKGISRSKISFSGTFHSIPTPELMNLIVPFCQALKQGLPVRLIQAGPERTTICEPRGIILSDSSIEFLYRHKGRRELSRMTSSDLVSISIVQRKGDNRRTKTG